MKPNYAALIDDLKTSGHRYGLLTMQATSTTRRLVNALPGKMVALFSAEHGFFGNVAAGEKTASTWHPFWNVPIHSLYGDHRKPNDEMMRDIEHMVIDMCDIGVRCYTYLATMKNVLEACAERNVPVSVLDRPIPRGGMLDGPMLNPSYRSFVAPVNIPFCHGMTPGECAVWMVQNEHINCDLTVHKLLDWNHRMRDPWANFVPPSPSIRSWDSAVMYPMTVFTEAFPALDCDRAGALAFRIIGAPWMNQKALVDDLLTPLRNCGVTTRPYRYQPQSGMCKGQNLNGILFTTIDDRDFYPVTASTMILAALMARHPRQMAINARPEWMNQLCGTSKVYDTIHTAGDLNELFVDWITGQDEFIKTRVNLYK